MGRGGGCGAGRWRLRARASVTKLDEYVSSESEVPMRVKIRLRRGMVAALAGTWQPTCAISAMSATCRR